MHPKDNNPPPRAPMEEEEDTNPSAVSGSSDLDVVVSDSSSAVRVTGAEVLSERLETDAAVEAAQDPRLGETLVGRYRLDKLVGKGGMGRVYRATQFPLNRRARRPPATDPRDHRAGQRPGPRRRSGAARRRSAAGGCRAERAAEGREPAHASRQTDLRSEAGTAREAGEAAETKVAE